MNLASVLHVLILDENVNTYLSLFWILVVFFDETYSDCIDNHASFKKMIMHVYVQHAFALGISWEYKNHQHMMILNSYISKESWRWNKLKSSFLSHRFDVRFQLTSLLVKYIPIWERYQKICGTFVVTRWDILRYHKSESNCY